MYADYANKKVLNIDEACDFIGYAKSYVYKLVADKILPHSKPAKRLFFEKEKLEQWMLSNPRATRTDLDKAAATYVSINGKK